VSNDFNKFVEDLMATFERTKSRITSDTNVSKSIGKIVLFDVLENFESEGAKNGTRWKELKESTIKQRKKKKKWPGKILNVTSRLRNSLGVGSNNGEVIIGSNVSYAKYIQGGTSFMKAREFLPKELSADALLDIEDSLLGFLK
jgi:phage gpG-like protein